MFEIILYQENLFYFLICILTFLISFYSPSIGGGITFRLAWCVGWIIIYFWNKNYRISIDICDIWSTNKYN